MLRNNAHGDDEIVQRNLYVSSQVNANNAKGLTDLKRFAFNNPPEKDPTNASTSLTNQYNTPLTSSHFPFSPALNGYESSGPMSRIVPRSIYPGSQPSANHEFSYDPGYGPRSPREIQYTPGFQESLPREFDLEGYEHASHSPQYGPHENLPAFDLYSVREWSNSPVSTSMFPRSSSSLKVAPTRTRTRTTPRHQHHQYLDSLLRSKCPKDRAHALNVAIQFRDEHSAGELIPNDLLDELLEATGDDKYFCFCCPRARKARTITPARDHVRKSLGNFPFQCSNSWCRHSSLRQADLNKHMKTCVNTASQ